MNTKIDNIKSGIFGRGRKIRTYVEVKELKKNKILVNRTREIVKRKTLVDTYEA